MKRLAIIAMLFGTAAFAQTTTDTTQIATPVNPQITDAVTQVQHDKLAARVTELEKIVDELTRRDLLDHSRVLFDSDSINTVSSTSPIIDEIVKFMKDYPAYGVTIEGHADDRGTRVYNLSLGEKRASAVRDILVSKGIDANRIRTISYGKERPVVLDDNEEAWAQNRRAVFVLYK